MTRLTPCPFCGNSIWLEEGTDDRGFDVIHCGLCDITFLMHSKNELTKKKWRERPYARFPDESAHSD